MTDQDDEKQSNPFEEPTEQERRDFLHSLGKWSQAVISGVLLGGAAIASSPARADSWINRHGGWYNWPGGEYRHGGGWYNRGRGWYNRLGFNDHGGPINDYSDWYNRLGRWYNHYEGGWHNRGGNSWVNRQ